MFSCSITLVFFIITLLAIKYLQYRTSMLLKEQYSNKPETIKLSRVWLLL